MKAMAQEIQNNLTPEKIDDLLTREGGLASVIADRGEAAALRQAQVLRAEESAEVALKVRTSLSTIREWAEQMKADGNGGMRGLAGDISAEAGSLEKVVGQFLAGNEKAKGAHA